MYRLVIFSDKEEVIQEIGRTLENINTRSITIHVVTRLSRVSVRCDLLSLIHQLRTKFIELGYTVEYGTCSS